VLHGIGEQLGDVPRAAQTPYRIDHCPWHRGEWNAGPHDSHRHPTAALHLDPGHAADLAVVRNEDVQRQLGRRTASDAVPPARLKPGQHGVRSTVQ
jgi:hypothetical protein